MILNLSLSFADVEEVAAHFDLDLKKESIIDCSTNLKMPHLNFYSICEIEDFDKINERSTREYIQQIGKLSQVSNRKNKSIREIKILDYSLFWFTALAIKRPDLSLGKTTYLLHNILPYIKDRIGNEKLYIAIPKRNEHYVKFVSRILNRHGITNIYFINKTKPLLTLFFQSSLKLLVFYLRSRLLFSSSKKGKTNITAKNYFITYTNTHVDENYSDFFLSDLKNYSDTLTAGAYWPVFSSFTPLKKSGNCLSDDYKRSIPGILAVTRLLVQSLAYVLFFRWNPGKIDDVFFEEEYLLKNEIKIAAIESMGYFFHG